MKQTDEVTIKVKVPKSSTTTKRKRRVLFTKIKDLLKKSELRAEDVKIGF